MTEIPEIFMDNAQSHCEQMRSMQLFSEEEIQKIKRTREHFDQKIAQTTAVIKDYVEYIKYELNLITRVKEKKTPTVHASILTSIADRIKVIYTQALTKFPNNLRFWDEYIKFLHTAKFTRDISIAFDQMLLHHSGNLEAWLRAIRWEYTENFNDDHIKDLLMRAQKHHPDSEKLYLFSFRIELENKQQFPEVEALQNADIVYMNAKKKFTHFDFYIDLLNVVDKIEYASEMQQKILEDMETLYKHKEMFWHTMAQRALNGISRPNQLDDENIIKTEYSNDGKLNVKSLKTETSLRKRIENCSKVYLDAVKIVDTPKMWNLYVNAMIELNTDLSTQSSLKRFVLKQAFEAADQSNHLQEDHYLQYIELLYANNPKDDTIDSVLQKSTGIYKNSQKLWLYRMRYYIFEDSFKKLEEIFREIKLLEASGAELWRTYLVYLRSRRRSDTEEAFKVHLEELAHQPYRSFNILKAQMIELFATTESMDRARTLYELFTRLYPNCYEVHEMMAELESKQMKRNRESEKFCLDRMIKNFGHTRTDVWLRYMRYEQYADKPENVVELHEKALNTLKPELLAEFNKLYNDFMNGAS